MKRIYSINGLVMLLLLTLSFTACKKLEHDEGFTSIGEVFFDASNVAINKTTAGRLLDVRTSNGYPVEWTSMGTGKLIAPEGERTFEFYDKRTGEVLAEKTVNVVAGNPERWTLFQPEEGQQISILDLTAYAQEPAASEGQIKIRFANYATGALPYEEIDIVVWGEGLPQGDVPLDTIENVGKSFDGSGFHTIYGSNKNLIYHFSFIDKASQKEIVRVNGTRYTTKGRATSFSPTNFSSASKGIFVMYLTHSNVYDDPGTGTRMKLEQMSRYENGYHL